MLLIWWDAIIIDMEGVIEMTIHKNNAGLWIWILTGVLVCCCIVMLVLGLNARSKIDKEEPGDEETKLQKALQSYIKEEQNDGENLPLMLQYQNKILAAITFDIQSFDVDTGTMDVEFTYIDVLSLADSISEETLSADTYYNRCIERIDKQSYTTKTKEIKVSLESTEMGYKIVKTDALVNVLSGGVLNYYIDRLEEAAYE